MAKYSKEYKKEAIALVLKNGRRIRQTACELGISHDTLKDWVKMHDRAEEEMPVPSSGLTLKEECRLLRKRVAYKYEFDFNMMRDLYYIHLLGLSNSSKKEDL